MSRLLFVTIVAAALALVAAATAGECRHFFAAPVVQHHAVQVVAPVHHSQAVVAHAFPQILYQAGYAIEQEAISEKAALRALAKFKAYELQAARSPAVATPSPVPAADPTVFSEEGRLIGKYNIETGKWTPANGYSGPAPPPPPPLPPLPGEEARNIVAEKCGKCHSGAAPKAGLTIDGVTGMPCDAITASLRAIKDDRMPKGGGLTPEEKGLLMEALLALESK